MAKRKKVMNAAEMEKWLLQKGAAPVTEATKQEPWYKEVSKLPVCMDKKALAGRADSLALSLKNTD